VLEEADALRLDSAWTRDGSVKPLGGKVALAVPQPLMNCECWSCTEAEAMEQYLYVNLVCF